MPDFAAATVLIDGIDVIAQLEHVFRGFSPSTMFGHPSPLSPPLRPRRVAICLCGCLSAYCDAMAPLVSADAVHVRWSDFRSYGGVFQSPTVDHEPRGGHPVGIDDVVFDRAQYEAELDRVAAEHSPGHPPGRRPQHS